MNYWWLSFATEEGCRGVAIVRGANILDAAKRAHELRINPGGEIQGFEIPPDDPEAIAEINELGVDRLICPDELWARGYRKRSELPENEVNAHGEKLGDYLDSTTEVIEEKDNE